MKNGRRTIGICLATALLLVAATAESAPTVPRVIACPPDSIQIQIKSVTEIQQAFDELGVTDVNADQWFAASILWLVQVDLIEPDSAGSIHPEAGLSTGEGVSVFARVLGVASKRDTPEEAFQKAAGAGLVNSGVSPEHDMTRIEAARLLANALEVKPREIGSAGEYPFSDLDTLDSPKDAGILVEMYDLGIFKGFEDRTFRPHSVLTRAQIAIVIERILFGAEQ